MQAQFFDHFFFWVFASATGLTAIDWWIGPEGRARMRERVGDWWLYVTERSFMELIAEDAYRVRSWLRTIFGEWLSFRAAILCTTISLLASLGLVAASMMVTRVTMDLDASQEAEASLNSNFFFRSLFHSEMDIEYVRDFVSEWPDGVELLSYFNKPKNEEEFHELILELRVYASEMRFGLSQLFEVAIPLLTVNAVLDWLSLGITVTFLGWMTQSVSSKRLVVIVAADVFLSVFFAVMTIAVVIIYNSGGIPYGVIENYLSVWQSVHRFVSQLRQVHQDLGVWQGVVFIPVAILFTSALPTLLHLFVAVAFLGSKLLKPFLQPVIGRALYLFHISEKGVLTQFAVGAGVILKAGQEAVKYFAN